MSAIKENTTAQDMYDEAKCLTIYEDWNEIDGKIYYRWRKKGEKKWHTKLTAYKEKPVMRYRVLTLKELEKLESRLTNPER